MPTFDGFAAFNRELDAMAKEIAVSKRRKITGTMADKAQEIIRAEVTKDVGSDRKFRGWAPKLVTEVKFTKEGAAIVHPTRSSAGPITVANQGRNQGNASGFAGPGINRRTGITSRTKSGGIRQQRNRRAKRWNGVTRGFGTADRAVAAMERLIPKVAEDGVRKIQVRHFDVD